MDEPAIEFSGLTRYFGEQAAVRDLSLTVRRGEVYALLGKNGSGKSTAIGMLMGFVEPTRGDARLLGAPSRALPPSVRERVAYLAENHPLYPWMRLDELASFAAGTHPRFDRRRFAAFLELFRLDPRKPVRALSNGQRAQASLAVALSQDPEVLVLDDPTLGVDADVRQDFLEAVVDLVARAGRTVLMTTHALADVERIADRVGIIHEGVLRADLPLDDLRRSVVRYRLLFDGDPPALEAPRVLVSRRIGRELLLTVARPGPDTERALRLAGARDVREEPLSLEEAFVAFVGAGRPPGRSLSEIAAG